MARLVDFVFADKYLLRNDPMRERAEASEMRASDGAHKGRADSSARNIVPELRQSKVGGKRGGRSRWPGSAAGDACACARPEQNTRALLSENSQSTSPSRNGAPRIRRVRSVSVLVGAAWPAPPVVAARSQQAPHARDAPTQARRAALVFWTARRSNGRPSGSGRRPAFGAPGLLRGRGRHLARAAQPHAGPRPPPRGRDAALIVGGRPRPGPRRCGTSAL